MPSGKAVVVSQSCSAREDVAKSSGDSVYCRLTFVRQHSLNTTTKFPASRPRMCRLKAKVAPSSSAASMRCPHLRTPAFIVVSAKAASARAPRNCRRTSTANTQKPRTSAGCWRVAFPRRKRPRRTGSVCRPPEMTVGVTQAPAGDAQASLRNFSHPLCTPRRGASVPFISFNPEHRSFCERLILLTRSTRPRRQSGSRNSSSHEELYGENENDYP